jgi:glucoamylase
LPKVYERYVTNKTGSKYEIWTFAHQIQEMSRRKTLRIITGEPTLVHWSADDWKTANDIEPKDSGIGCFYADIPKDAAGAGRRIVFTLRAGEKWVGEDYLVKVL